MAISDTTDEHLVPIRGTAFSEQYKAKIFQLWYKSSRPHAKALLNLIDIKDERLDEIPSVNILGRWIKTDFVNMAVPLDEEVANALQTKLVSDQIEMLIYQSEIARELYELGINFFREHGIKGERTALTAVVEGLKIERETRGAPVIAGSIRQMSDTELLDTLTGLVAESEVLETEPHESKYKLSDM